MLHHISHIDIFFYEAYEYFPHMIKFFIFAFPVLYVYLLIGVDRYKCISI